MTGIVSVQVVPGVMYASMSTILLGAVNARFPPQAVCVPVGPVRPDRSTSLSATPRNSAGLVFGLDMSISRVAV